MQIRSRIEAVLSVVGVFFLLLALALFTGGGAGSRAPQAIVYYVSPSGSDSNPGTLDQPWQTIAYALVKLSPGDLLYLRGGTYYEREIYTSLKGTAAAPITIQSYPGERALIDGGVPDFTTAPNSEWELVNSALQLYRSKRTFAGTFVGAWLVEDDIQLVEYGSAQNLESTNYGPVNGLTPFYMGPGVQLRADSRLYIRLQPNPNDLTDSSGRPIAPTPSDANPNNNKIAIFTADDLLDLKGAEYLHFKDLDLSGAKKIINGDDGSHHIELDGCRLNYSRYGLVIRAGAHDWDIHDNEFNNGLPDYVYWTDVKNGDSEVAEAYPEFQSSAIGGAMPGFNIHDNEFHHTFDGLEVEDGTFNASIISNTFRYVRDDAINLYKGIGDVEVAYNMLWRVGSGLSILGSSAGAGQVYIHHNVIDNSAYQHGGRPGNYREEDWPVWTTIHPFATHSAGDKSGWWKIYNNTIVTRRSGYNWNAAGPEPVTGNSQKYTYNNIFYVIDDRVVFRDDLASTGSHYNGNVIYRKAPGSFPLFITFGDGNDYDSLADFRINSGTVWEVNGLAVDPGFDVSAIDDPSFNPATIWDRYRPANNQVFTAGASYCGLNWPGTAGVNYRGALPPAVMQPGAGPCTLFLPIVSSR